MIKRLHADIEIGKRTADIIERSVSRLNMHNLFDTINVDTDGKSVSEIAEEIKLL